MDGIDGIAGIQALTAGFGWMLVGKFLGLETIGFYGGVIALSSLGFLILNWQPAKIFMGDVGSAFLGYSFAVMPLLENADSVGYIQSRRILPFIALIIVGLFVFDTVFTFVRRVFNKEKVWEAHRGHIYQRLVISGFSHQSVAILYGLISILTIAVTFLWVIKSGF
jgi:UDP-N-acetylmuramyl pentapeptide phosphotransferase/UDP-N-acetylglucosamine-1-phosphate transferase